MGKNVVVAYDGDLGWGYVIEEDSGEEILVTSDQVAIGVGGLEPGQVVEIEKDAEGKVMQVTPEAEVS